MMQVDMIDLLSIRLVKSNAPNQICKERTMQSKIVLIGAGSHSFGLMTLKDLMDTPQLYGSEIVLVDINAAKLERMHRLALRLNEIWQTGFRITAATDRREALPGADIVVTSVERKPLRDVEAGY